MERLPTLIDAVLGCSQAVMPASVLQPSSQRDKARTGSHEMASPLVDRTIGASTQCGGSHGICFRFHNSSRSIKGDGTTSLFLYESWRPVSPERQQNFPTTWECFLTGSSGSVRPLDRLRKISRQQNRKHRPSAGSPDAGVHADGTVMLINDLLADPKSQT